MAEKERYRDTQRILPGHRVRSSLSPTNGMTTTYFLLHKTKNSAMICSESEFCRGVIYDDEVKASFHLVPLPPLVVWCDDEVMLVFVNDETESWLAWARCDEAYVDPSLVLEESVEGL